MRKRPKNSNTQSFNLSQGVMTSLQPLQRRTLKCRNICQRESEEEIWESAPRLGSTTLSKVKIKGRLRTTVFSFLELFITVVLTLLENTCSTEKQYHFIYTEWKGWLCDKNLKNHYWKKNTFERKNKPVTTIKQHKVPRNDLEGSYLRKMIKLNW